MSMYRSSVGVFTQFLSSLSHLLDRAEAHAVARKIDPSILLHTRLYPDMYNLTRQVGEAIRHAVLACSLLAAVEPPVFADSEPDIAELKARIATAIDFMGPSAARRDQRRRRQASGVRVQEWFGAKFYRPIAAADFQRPPVL